MEKAVKTLFTPVSQNAKTGPIPVTITEKASCWTGCALYGKGRYAFYGALGHFWSGVSEGTRGGSWDELCATVAALPMVLRPGRRSARHRRCDRRRAAVAARDRQSRQAGDR